MLDAELPSIMKTFLQGKLFPFSLLLKLKLATLFLIRFQQIITKDIKPAKKRQDRKILVQQLLARGFLLYLLVS